MPNQRAPVTPPVAALRELLVALTRSGAAEELARRVLDHAGDEPAVRLEALGAVPLVELEGWEPSGPRRRREPGLEGRSALRLVGWQLPAALGGQVFLELRRRRSAALRPVGARDLFSLAHVAISGAWRGTETRLRVRTRSGQEELARFTRVGAGLADEVEAAVHRIADPAGARVQSSAGVAIWD